MKACPRVSLVIPARNEADYLGPLLDSVPADVSVEVIVADNASTDDSAAIAAERGCTVVPIETRVIGAVRNAGARAANGSIVAFVDADSVLHAEVFRAIEEALEDHGCVGGASGIRMERWSAGIAATYALMRATAAVSGLDTGVIFCRREDFEAIGGFREDIRFAEDVHFLLALRALGRKRGQAFRRLEGVPTTTSTRKFDVYGDWHYLKNLCRSLYNHKFNPSALHAWADEYWYDETRSRR